MTYSNYLIPSDDITIITQVSEIYNASGTLQYVDQSYYHMPFLFWVVIFAITAGIFSRFLLEAIIKLRKK